jgi:hypothetical protein
VTAQKGTKVNVTEIGGVSAAQGFSAGPAAIPASAAMQVAAGTGNPAGTSLPVTGYATAILNIVSSTPMSGGTTVNFEGSVDDVTWVPMLAHKVGASGNQASTTTTDGDFRLNVSGYKSVRARISAWSAGVTTITGYVSPLSAQGSAISIASVGGVAPSLNAGATDAGTLRVTIGNADVVNTQLPTAAALSDAVTNPTAPAVGGFLMGWDATQWKRLLQIGGILRAAVGQSGVAADGDTNTHGYIVDQSGLAKRLAVAPVIYNGATWDRPRGNVDQTVGITASGVTTTQTGTDQTNYNGRGVIVVLDMTNVGTGSVTITIQGKDVASGKYYTLLAGAAVVTNVTNVYTVYPAVTAAANVSANSPLPRTWRVVVTANNANPASYTVGASVLL